jgi:heavy metal sensor kinase
VIRFRPRHVRSRLTLWYVSVLAAVLLLFSIGTSVLLFWQLRAQMDRYNVQDVETVEGLLYFTPGGQLGLKEDYHNHPESKLVLERLLEVRAPDGAVLYRNARLGNRSLGGEPFPGEGVGGYSNRAGRLADGTRIRMVSRRHNIDGRPTLIRLAYSEEHLWLHLEELLGASLLALPLTLAVAGFAGYALARRALAPLEQMARRAEEITSDRLSGRLPTSPDDVGDELDQLARVFNNTLGRLEQSFEQLRRFTSDASHELRTPLAAMRSVGEVGLQKGGGAGQYRDTIGSMLEEVNRLTRLVDALLTISRADAGAIQFHPSVFSVLELAREAAALLEVLMEEKSIKLILSGDESAAVKGDRLFLRQSLVNIIHNAVKYSPPRGTISVHVGHDETARVVVEIADDGPGIPAEHLAHVFDRFYRVDKSRSRNDGGAGLGLSIASWAVKAHGGEIGLDSAPGSGCIFRICLPAAAPM